MKLLAGGDEVTELALMEGPPPLCASVHLLGLSMKLALLCHILFYANFPGRRTNKTVFLKEKSSVQSSPPILLPKLSFVSADKRHYHLWLNICVVGC